MQSTRRWPGLTCGLAALLLVAMFGAASPRPVAADDDASMDTETPAADSSMSRPNLPVSLDSIVGTVQSNRNPILDDAVFVDSAEVTGGDTGDDAPPPARPILPPHFAGALNPVGR